MRLSKNQQRVFALQSELSDAMSLIEDNRWDYVNYELIDCGSHNCSDVVVSEHIDDYQVFRCFDIEYEYADLHEMAQQEFDSLPEAERKKIEDADAYDAWESDKYDEYMDDGMDIEIEIGEYRQIWWNVKTGQMVYLGKVRKENPRYCDFDAEWQILNVCCATHTARRFAKAFPMECFFVNYGFYYDISVHPTIRSWGYDQLNAINWSLHCDEDEQHSDESRLYLQHCNDWIGFIKSFEHGNNMDSITKPYGLHTYIRMGQLATEDEKKAYLAAVKIACRNHYEIKDRQMWDEMVHALWYIGKDVHNAHYVCPADFRTAHDAATKAYHKKYEAERQKRELEKAQQEAAAYLERISKYLPIRLSDDNFDIFVCPSVQAMAEEGTAMHHCVFRMGYYLPDKNCLILLVRDKDDKRVATVELSTKTWKIIQTRAACNGVPQLNGKPCDDTINNLISKNIRYFKDPSKWAERQAKVVKLPIAAKAEPIAIAA